MKAIFGESLRRESRSTIEGKSVKDLCVIFPKCTQIREEERERERERKRRGRRREDIDRDEREEGEIHKFFVFLSRVKETSEDEF